SHGRATPSLARGEARSNRAFHPARPALILVILDGQLDRGRERPNRASVASPGPSLQWTIGASMMIGSVRVPSIPPDLSDQEPDDGDTVWRPEGRLDLDGEQ